MKYQGDALGLVETRGMVPAIAAADVMCKAADVELISYENVGSGLVTVLVCGDVAAVTTAVEAGARAAAACGEMTAKNVMPRPIGKIKHIVDAHELDADE
ncbi:BMC domain-containing protein [uncultured Veillonella sp.]|uniref:BMC domain-containing protein n=1 Tax=uncultured Veillonella sp. TaxID=159268 RepID=UPI0026302521|nr:BMC domain-containing protein [uncultured Veillonella sp.]